MMPTNPKQGEISDEKLPRSPSATSGLSTRFDFEDDFALDNNGLDLDLRHSGSSCSASSSQISERSSTSTVDMQRDETKPSMLSRCLDNFYGCIFAVNLIVGCVLINISSSWLYCQYHLKEPLCEYFRPDYKGK
ncbi:unnamed protein product [Oikopleura dioica]|uniref:Uncharacterized protein n=1 Tax=Oikopleura dioica TaxID=34765 RepID=E4Y6A9_OIKDI|nr:unnamed protein product [Oikopleura dioica]